MDLLGGMLFIFVHLHVLHPIVATHPTYVFPSFVDDTHIIGSTSNMILVFLHLEEEFITLGY
jgi:hypothetical protein